MQSRHSKLYCLCSRDIQNFIVCAVATFKTLLFVQSRHSKLYCLCSRDIQNFIVCAVATFKTLLFVQSRHSKLYCLCSRDIQNFIVCAIATFKTLLFVQSQHSKLYCLCSRAIRNFLVCVSLLGLRSTRISHIKNQLHDYMTTRPARLTGIPATPRSQLTGPSFFPCSRIHRTSPANQANKRTTRHNFRAKFWFGAKANSRVPDWLAPCKLGLKLIPTNRALVMSPLSSSIPI